MSANHYKKAVAQSFSRAAQNYDDVAYLQRQVGEDLLATVAARAPFETALDIGCGTGQLTRLLTQHGKHVTALDFAPGMLAFAREHHGDVIADFVCADAETLPFADNHFDLVFSNFALQWCESLPALLQNLLRVLKPGGWLTFSIPGAATLWELRQSWFEADPSHVHVNTFVQQAEVEQAVSAAGFGAAEIDLQRQTLYYPSVRAMTAELKTLGAHNVNRGRSTHLTGKQCVNAFVSAYEQLRTEQGLPATWDIIRVTAQKPALTTLETQA